MVLGPHKSSSQSRLGLAQLSEAAASGLGQLEDIGALCVNVTYKYFMYVFQSPYIRIGAGSNSPKGTV
jgi:hypothetical protein